MKFVTWLLYIYLAVILDNFSVAQEQQQECVVGADGACLNTEDSTIPNVQEETTIMEKVADEPEVEIDKNCPDRGHIIRCTGAHLDLNKNGKLDRDELDAAIQSLPWYVRIFSFIMGMMISEQLVTSITSIQLANHFF